MHWHTGHKSPLRGSLFYFSLYNVNPFIRDWFIFFWSNDWTSGGCPLLPLSGAFLSFVLIFSTMAILLGFIVFVWLLASWNEFRILVEWTFVAAWIAIMSPFLISSLILEKCLGMKRESFWWGLLTVLGGFAIYAFVLPLFV